MKKTMFVLIFFGALPDGVVRAYVLLNRVMANDSLRVADDPADLNYSVSCRQ